MTDSSLYLFGCTCHWLFFICPGIWDHLHYQSILIILASKSAWSLWQGINLSIRSKVKQLRQETDLSSHAAPTEFPPSGCTTNTLKTRQLTTMPGWTTSMDPCIAWFYDTCSRTWPDPENTFQRPFHRHPDLSKITYTPPLKPVKMKKIAYLETSCIDQNIIFITLLSPFPCVLSKTFGYTDLKSAQVQSIGVRTNPLSIKMAIGHRVLWKKLQVWS